ncbi:hypothetical protein OAM33_00580 [Candidatus Pelagibacter sp.]|nr:hypothetical protein [Candidatus Pelagibacter sp.]
MIKKITLAFLLCCLLASCGKKSPPKYEDPEKKAKNETILKAIT